jgi:hypothetical protein
MHETAEVSSIRLPLTVVLDMRSLLLGVGGEVISMATDPDLDGERS